MMNFGRKRKSIQRTSTLLVSDVFVIVVCCIICSACLYIQQLRTADFVGKIALLRPFSESIVGISTTRAGGIWGGGVVLENITSLQEGNSRHEGDGTVAIQLLLNGLQNLFPDSSLLRITKRYEETLYDLMGKESPQKYLIALQNTNEVRPNGGFFGSYGILTVDRGKIVSLTFRDSYLPGFDRPGVGIQGPQWLLNMIPTNEIHFVGANKIGFTYADGGHIKKLYELAYPDDTLRGVVFVRLDRLLQHLPELKHNIIERQFINAMAEKIPKSSREKKSLYLNEIERTTKDSLVPFLLEHLSSVTTNNKYLDIYLEDIPGDLHTILQEYRLTTRFENQNLYLRDSNTSYSKTDGFVEKETTCIPTQCDSKAGCSRLIGSEIITIEKSGKEFSSLLCTKQYRFDIPQDYLDTIKTLETKYNVALGERERHILGVEPVWGNRGVVYFGDKREVAGLTGDIYEESFFDIPFGKAMSYNVRLEGGGTRTVSWTMIKK